MLTDNNFAGALHHGVFSYYFADGINEYFAREGILYRYDVALYRGVDFGVLEGEIRPFHRAVDKL